MKIGFAIRPSPKAIVIVTLVLIAVGAFVGFRNISTRGVSSTFDQETGLPATYSINPELGSYIPTGEITTPIGSSGATTLEETQTFSSSSSESLQSTTPISSGGAGTSPVSQENSPQQENMNASGYIEFFSNVTVQVNSAEIALSKATAISHVYGGYLAFSSYSNLSSIAVIRIPVANYVPALSEIEALGNLTGAESNSNDVSVQYTDLNATLQSFLTEQASLQRLENASNTLNSTLLLEGQIQGVDAQINEIQSQILQTRLLIDYSTITASFNVKLSGPPPAPLKMKLTATPLSGMNPLSVTFNTIVSGGETPYIVNYNFGDGSSYQGQTLIHTFTQSGTFNVNVTLTDSSGNVLENYTTIRVISTPTQSQFLSFTSYALGQLVSVVEGIIEIAIVLIPIVLVVGAVILPFRNRIRTTKKDGIKG